MSAGSVPELGAARAQLAPAGRAALAAACACACELHADEVGQEHLLKVLMDASDSAAQRLAVHAFADPPSIAVEALALAQGILVVGSETSLPFSVRAVLALRAARQLGDARPQPPIEPGDLFACALGELDAPLRAAAGLEQAAIAPFDPALPPSRALFRGYALRAKQALANSCKLASRWQRRRITPAHVLLACVEADPDWALSAGISLVRTRAALAGKDDDPTPPEQRALPIDAPLAALLERLPAHTGTLELLAQLAEHGSTEIQALLRRHKLTPALLRSAASTFRDD